MTDTDEDTGFDIKAVFDFAVEVGTKLDQISESQKDYLSYLRKATPISNRFAASGIVDASGDPLLLNFGTPSQGTFWEVRQVVVGGTEVNVTTAGECGLYVSPSASVAGAGMMNCVDIASFTTLPNVGYYPSGTIYVRPSEYLYLIAWGATANQQLAANCFARVFNDDVAERYFA